MHGSKVRSRLKVQLTKFCSELSSGLSKPLGKFVAQMLYGIQSSQDVKLRNIGRARGEAIPLIRTEKRLSRNLKHAELEAELTTKLERFQNSRALSRVAKGGIFLRKMPLGSSGSGVQQFWNRCRSNVAGQGQLGASCPLAFPRRERGGADGGTGEVGRWA
jgi:hypothetical protein